VEVTLSLLPHPWPDRVVVSIGLAAVCLWIAARAFVRENA